jgi:hypothetical protein
MLGASMEDVMADIVGSWELQSLYRQRHDGSREALYGDRPSGRLTYTPDGVVHAILVSDDRPCPSSMDMADKDRAGLFQTMVAYSGTYRVEGNKVIHAVDVSWNQLWTSTDLVRFYELKDDVLRIITAPTVDPLDGTSNIYVLEWRRRTLRS